MDDRIIYYIDENEDDLRNPVMIVGLPGVGHVGKFVADHLVDALKAEKIADIYSKHFPPQVIVGEDNTVSLVGNRLYLANMGKMDILILAGDSQSGDPSGHYNLCDMYMEMASRFKVNRIYTLGGYPTGIPGAENYVIGAVNDIKLIDELKEKGVQFNPSEPPGGIVGASGLILAFAQSRNIDAACLMGTTAGYIADPRSSKELLNVLCRILGIEVDPSELDEKIKNMDQMVEKIRDSVTGEEYVKYVEQPENEDDLVYFG
jgi:TIGR00162 family protein